MKSATEFVSLRNSDDPIDYHRASHEEAPNDVWLAVIREYPDMAKWVAQNKTISPCIMDELIEIDDVSIHLVLAMKRSCPARILLKLATSRYEAVRNAVALNKKTPSDILHILTNDEWEICASNAAIQLARRNHSRP